MTIRMKFDDADRITIHGMHYKPMVHTDNGVVLDQIACPGVTESYTFDDLTKLLASCEMRVARGYFDRTTREEALRGGVEFLSQLPEESACFVSWKGTCVEVFFELFKKKGVRKTAQSILAATTVMSEKVHQREAAAQQIGHKPRAGEKLEHRIFPKPSTLLLWVRAYEQAGHSAVGLVPQSHRSGNKSARFCIKAEALLAAQVDKYADYQRPSKRSIVAATLDAFGAKNIERMKSGEEPLLVPLKRTINRRISALDPYYIHCKRFGIAAASRKFNVFELGVATTRPMERVEMDEWQVDLINLLAPTGLLEHVDPKCLDEVLRGRRWVCAAIDHRTRCVLAMRLIETPAAFEAVRTLEDVTRNKTDIALAMGCESPWDQHGGINTIVTDQGSAFVSHEFRTAVTDLGGTIEYPPAGVPTLRSTIERSFRTFGTKLMPLLAGRTFSNVIERGDYNSNYWASLSDDELIQVLVMFVVDIYHNEPHIGLQGETPANCWKRLVKDYPVPCSPDGHTHRAVFGSRHMRRLSGRGVRVFNIDYACDALRNLFIHSEQQDVEVRIDQNDLGWAAVKIGDNWHAAPALQEGFDGVSYAQWSEATRELRVKHRRDSVLSRAAVLRALSRITDINKAAMLRTRLTPYCPTQKQLEQSERDLFLGVIVALPANAELTPPPEADLFDGKIEFPKPDKTSASSIDHLVIPKPKQDQRSTEPQQPPSPLSFWKMEDK